MSEIVAHLDVNESKPSISSRERQRRAIQVRGIFFVTFVTFTYAPIFEKKSYATFQPQKLSCWKKSYNFLDDTIRHMPYAFYVFDDFQTLLLNS